MPAKSKSREPSPSPNPFVDFPRPPEPADIRQVLGRSASAWDELRTRITEHFGQVTEKWVVPAKNYGWSLRLKLKKRTILHLGPRSKHFIAAIILGRGRSQLFASLNSLLRSSPSSRTPARTPKGVSFVSKSDQRRRQKSLKSSPRSRWTTEPRTPNKSWHLTESLDTQLADARSAPIVFSGEETLPRVWIERWSEGATSFHRCTPACGLYCVKGSAH